MDYNSEKNTVTLFNKSEKLETLANRLASLSGEQVYSLFATRGITIPRKMNCMALTSVINCKLKVLHASELSKDYFLRLKYYKEFSEVQLFNLFLNICNTKEYFKQYRVNLFKLILINHVGLNLMDGEIKYLKDLKKLTVEPFEDYFQFISSMCQEQEDTFDGQSMNVLRDFLVNSASSSEIVNLGKKYGIELSLSLKKTDLIEYMKHYLDHAGELNKSLEYEIDSSTVSGLNSLCKKYRIPMSSNMTKNELVTYLFFILSQCEITQTSVKRIETTKEYEPLEFTIDMNVFKGFIPDDSQRIIHYEGEENDSFDSVVDAPKLEEAILALEEEPETVVDTKSTSQALDEIQKKRSLPLEESNPPKSDLVLTNDLPIQEEIISIDEEEVPAEEVEEEKLDEEEIESVEEVESFEPKEDDLENAVEESIPVASSTETPSEDEKKEEIVRPHGLPMDDVRENDKFGNDKLRRLAEGPGRIILWSIIAILLIGIAGFLIWIFITE